jgi:hypothetical protein
MREVKTMTRTESQQKRIERLLDEIVEEQRSSVRFAVNNNIDYLRKYEADKLTIGNLVYLGWCIAKSPYRVKQLYAIADEAVGDPYVMTRREMNVVFHRLAAHEARLALGEDAEIDRLARADRGDDDDDFDEAALSAEAESEAA